MNERVDDGDCFVKSAQLLLAASVDGVLGFDDIRLVHGMVSGQGPLAGQRFVHAWAEVHDDVLDYSNGNRIIAPRELYYAVGEVVEEELVRYNVAQYRYHVMSSDHHGPWDRIFMDDLQTISVA